MRKMIISALIAAVALPAVASAQSAGELRRDRRDIREEQQDVREAQRRGDRGDVRDERRDVRDARQEYREDLRDRNDDRRGYGSRNWGRNDWQSYRTGNRGIYARGNWRAPFRYNAFRVGFRIAPTYFGSRYWINDPWRYRLPRPRPYTRWVRHYNDVILVDYRRGYVVDVIRNFFW